MTEWYFFKNYFSYIIQLRKLEFTKIVAIKQFLLINASRVTCILHVY